MELIGHPIFVLTAVIALGLALGKVKIRGIALDNAAVVFVGLLFGHFGLLVPPIFQTLGLALFVFSIGMQSGPGFLASFGRQGWTWIAPTALMILTSAGVVSAGILVFHLDPKLALGLFTGGRSSNSALAVAVDSSASNLPALGHSLAYPLAILAILLFVRLLPRLLGAHIPQEEAAYLEKQKKDHPPLVTRTFQVVNPNVVGKTLGELHIGRMTGVNLSRILHRGEILVPTPELVLDPGDLVKAVGSEADLANVTLILGPETQAEHFVDLPLDPRNEALWFIVTNKDVVHQPLYRLGLLENYGATVTRLQRNGVEISPQGNTSLKYGDRIMVVAGKGAMPAVKKMIGDAGRTIDQDLLPLFLALALGVVVGWVQVPVFPGFTFSLGLTGGVLITSLLLGALGKTGPILWAVSEPSNRFVRSLGLLLFLAAVGTQAGSQVGAILGSQGWALAVTAVAVAVVPLVVLTLFCRVGLKMNIVSLMGLVSGATTCSPALAVAASRTETNLPQIAYATVFPFAMIFMMVCTQVAALWW